MACYNIHLNHLVTQLLRSKLISNDYPKHNMYILEHMYANICLSVSDDHLDSSINLCNIRNSFFTNRVLEVEAKIQSSRNINIPGLLDNCNVVTLIEFRSSVCKGIVN